MPIGVHLVKYINRGIYRSYVVGCAGLASPQDVLAICMETQDVVGLLMDAASILYHVFRVMDLDLC
jgi:arginine exporter protein ArgO